MCNRRVGFCLPHSAWNWIFESDERRRWYIYEKNAIHTCLLWVGTSTPGTSIIPSSATTLQSLVESDWKKMRKFTSTHAYVLPISVSAATYLCCIPRYLPREESGLSLGLVEIFIKKYIFFRYRMLRVIRCRLLVK